MGRVCSRVGCGFSVGDGLGQVRGWLWVGVGLGRGWFGQGLAVGGGRELAVGWPWAWWSRVG